MPDRQPLESGKDTNNSAQPAAMQQDRPPSAPQSQKPDSWLGLPRFSWSLTMIGLFVFTFAIVTFYLDVAVVGVAIAGVGLVLDDRKLRVPPPVLLFGVFVLWAFIGVSTSPYSDIAFDHTVEALKLLVIMLIVVNALRTEGQLRFYLLFVLVCYVLFPIRGTLVGGDATFDRVVWNYIYRNPNDLAALSLLALGIALGFMFSASSWIVRLGSGISVLMMFVIILLTQSRGAFIGLVVGMSPAICGLAFKRPVRLLLLVGVVAVIVALTVPAAVWDRLQGIEKLTNTSTIAEADEEGSAAQRFEILTIAAQIVADNPAFGIGLGAYPQENAKYAPWMGFKSTHNTYLNIAAELGLPGLALWCILVWSVLRFAHRTRRFAVPGQLATQQAWLERAIWAYLVAGMFGSYAKLTFPYLMLSVLWCSATLLASSSPGAPNPPTRQPKRSVCAE